VIKVLVVDDSPLMRKAIGGLLRAAGDMEVLAARGGAEALECLPVFRPDVVTLDVQMQDMDGLSCLRRIMVECPCRVVMLSSLAKQDADMALDAMELGAVDVMAKPTGAISLEDRFGPELVQRVRQASTARLRPTRYLRERVRLRSGAARPPEPAAPASIAARAATRPSPADCIVLIGCSTGGPPALEAVLSALPASFPWPIMVAQHMPLAFTGPLARRLDRLCALRVTEVTALTPVQPGCVYVGRGDADLLIGRRPSGLFAIAAPSSPDHRWHPSVDRLVTSALQHVEAARLVGILMTGMGDDGAARMAGLRAAGGRTVAEAEETAVVWGMPGELVRAGGAEVVAPVHRIAQVLLDWVP
jgi:two-component system chemotaxis response regulator CheB